MSTTGLVGKINGECTSEWKDNGTTGGYTSVKVEKHFGLPSSQERKQYCDKYIPKTASIPAYNICVSAPSVSLVYQRYQIPVSTSRYSLGCEATVYVVGYEKDSRLNYRNWMRNGEIRWSLWNGFGTYEGKSPYDPWWNSRCEDTLTSKANWIYTGDYRLYPTPDFVFDDGF